MNQSRALPRIPYLCNFLSSISWLTVSKAFEKFRETPHVMRLLSTEVLRMSVISKIASSVEWSFLNPNWYLNRILYLSINEMSWSLTIFSKTLPNGDKTAMGL